MREKQVGERLRGVGGTRAPSAARERIDLAPTRLAAKSRRVLYGSGNDGINSSRVTFERPVFPERFPRRGN
ncbi:hypothetical protein EVAR_22189_1 [Eumeta japonica]|uniref:Uncharacterized protein n=1 Tax=Eumeta variegata TaxID=151549 RepID=A0A4C1XZU3_EUMVA|nr:hypothetical protein EVAR_22189_1 [Eumeta japonica]